MDRGGWMFRLRCANILQRGDRMNATGSKGQAPQASLDAYLQRRGLGSGRPQGDKIVVDLEPQEADVHRLRASFRAVGPLGKFLLIQVRTRQRLSTAVRQDVLATCNLWNSRMRLPRAWFDDGQRGAVEGEVVLDGCTPFAALHTQAAFDALADAVIAGAQRFWRWADVHATW
jgi:hypothetical protein